MKKVPDILTPFPFQMNTHQLTTSAAIYFKPEQCRSVPWGWFERARVLFTEYNLSPVLFTAVGREFLADDCHVLAPAGNIVLWDEVLSNRGEQLIDALGSGSIESVTLDSPRAGAKARSDWHATVSVHLRTGELYVGLDEGLASDPAALLRRAFEMTKDLFDVRYGVAYKMPLAEEPDCYASGHVSTSYADVLELIRNRREWDSRPKSADKLWSEELWGQQRHLTGLFRGAYPANILSEAHLLIADLKTRPVGRISQLDTSHWLWELPEREIPKAEQLLQDRNALVRQAVN